MTASRVPKQVSGYHLEHMDGELLLHHPTSTKVVYLNETASLIWHLCDGQRTTDEVAELLRDSFPEPGGTIADDVEATLRLFVDHGAIEFV